MPFRQACEMALSQRDNGLCVLNQSIPCLYIPSIRLRFILLKSLFSFVILV